ncbi:hypothetical protein SDC9_103641 [bioreactor metagenome]|uniref:Uncharacterized protein n=1 Tax=bioreactor metagenome TaxID=1076179 RepID=A0A645AVK4_9ZZZZ
MRALAPLPELLPVVQVAGDPQSEFFGGLHRLERRRRRTGRDRGRDAGGVEPVRAVKDFFPVEIRGRDFRDRRVCAVVDDLRRSHTGTGLRVIDADPLAAAPDERSVDTESAKLPKRRIRHRVLGERRYERDRLSVVRERDGDVCLGASECRRQRRALKEEFAARR